MGQKINKVRGIAKREVSDFWQGKTPCWQMCHCPEFIKNECPATKYPSFPCWEVEGTYCKLSADGTNGTDLSICRLCRVYKRWGGNNPIELKLFGKGIDSFRRYLEEKNRAMSVTRTLSNKSLINEKEGKMAENKLAEIMKWEHGEVDKSHNGLVQVYSGPGKGKTTAALGLALRAVGHGLRPIMIKFLERDLPYGEDAFISRFQPFEIVHLSQGKEFSLSSLEERRSFVQEALSYAQRIVMEGNYNVVILDDVLNEVDLGVLSIDDVKRLISLKPEWVELIFTGSVAAPEIVKQADLVTQMLLIKHPLCSEDQPHVKSRRGIDY